MSMPFAALPPASLSDAALRALAGPASARMMAARGLAPLKPLDFATVLYHLAHDADAAVQSAAQRTADELPEKVIAGALADATIAAPVLDFFAPRVAGKPALIEAVLLNRAVADETVVALVPRLGERELEIVAQNEQRLLRCPAVIAALYLAQKTRMSTVDRVVELAVRNNVHVAGIPMWTEVVGAVLGHRGEVQPVEAEALDASFAAVARVAVGDAPALVNLAAVVPLDDGDSEAIEQVVEAEQRVVEEHKRHVPYDQLSVVAKLRLATMGNAFARALCIRDTIRMVAVAAINAPGMTDNEVVKYSANRGLASEIIQIIANTREWTKLYAVKVNLINNPKTPLPASMKFMPFMRDRELRKLARSKGVPSALAAQAKKLVTQKHG